MEDTSPRSSRGQSSPRSTLGFDRRRLLRLLESCKKHWDLLDDRARAEVMALVQRINRGYRSNRFLDKSLPNLHKKQKMFLGLESELEVLYGGAAAGGKSYALIAAALQYADVPNYSAIMFRRTYKDLSLAGALMDKAQNLLSDIEGCRWDGNNYSFHFDSRWTYELFASWKRHVGDPVPDPWRVSESDFSKELGSPVEARIAFGYMDAANDRYRYQGAEVQTVIFDELTQIPVENYLYLFSRMRRLDWIPIPIRIRSATNPGGQHGQWVKERFIPDDYLTGDKEKRFTKVWDKTLECGECYGTGGKDGSCIYCRGQGVETRYFVPARVLDNPSVDQDEYRRSLVRLNPLERERLEYGNWDITGEGHIFKESWFRFYHMAGDHMRWYDDDGQLQIAAADRLIYFVTADTASKTKTTSDYTVVAVWAMEYTTGRLFLLYAVRDRFEVPDIAPLIYRESARHGASFAIIEDASSGTGVIQQLKRGIYEDDRFHRMTILPYSPHGRDRDKVSRATVAAIKMSQGDVFFPEGQPPWLGAYVSELISFGSDESEHDDCVDTFSMAAWFADNHEHEMSGGGASRPTVIGGFRR